MNYERFKKILEKERRRIREEVESYRKIMVQIYEAGEKHYSDHMADMAILGRNSDEIAIKIDRLTKELREIDYALKKFETGKFGICEVCGSPIEEERLELIPYARYCSRCANAKEK